jgi:hypothetical protein
MHGQGRTGDNGRIDLIVIKHLCPVLFDSYDRQIVFVKKIIPVIIQPVIGKHMNIRPEMVNQCTADVHGVKRAFEPVHMLFNVKPGF